MMKKIFNISLLLDTHIWIWLMNGENKKIEKVRKLIDYATEDNTLFISAITPWETAMLANKNKIKLKDKNIISIEWIEKALLFPRIKVINITKDILLDSVSLPENNKIHKDPADRIIISTARLNNLTLITSDKKIIDYSENGNVKVFKNIK